MVIFRYTFLFFLVAVNFFSHAQHISVSVNLGEMINSEYEELNPVLSGDGTRLFFVRMNHPDNRYGRRKSQDIWFSEKDVNGAWTEAVRLPDAVNIARYNAVFWTNETGTELIVKGIFNRKGTQWKERGFSKITVNGNGKWGKPKPVKISGFKKQNDGDLSSAFFSVDEKTLLLSYSKTAYSKKSDIYISMKKKNAYSRPKKIKQVSSRYDEQAPFLTVDGKSMYFSSNLSGNYNIYKSEKNGDAMTAWTAPQPVNLGVNTSGWESYFRLTNDNSIAIYVSDQNSRGNADIFSLTVDTARKEKKEADLITFKGVIKDQYGVKLPVTHFRLIVDSVETNYINQSPDSAVFEVSLPVKDTYTVTSLLPGYHTDTVNLKTENRGLDLYDINLTAEKVVSSPSTVKDSKPLIFKLYGNVLDNETQQILPAEISPVFEFENAKVTSIDYNPSTGSYSIILSAEQNNPILNVSANGYRNFTKVIYPPSGTTAVNQNILLSKKNNVIIITGRLLSTQNNQPLDNIQGLRLTINGVLLSDLAYIQEEKSYQISLEKGKKYSLEPQLRGYLGVETNLDLTNSTGSKIERDLFFTPVEIGQSVKLEKIFFAPGSAGLLNESIPELKRISNFLKENPTMIIEIGGHTDNIGSELSNLKLSEERAKSVARYIILSGVPRERIEFKGYGESQPLVSNDTAKGREQNRRVEFKLLKK